MMDLVRAWAKVKPIAKKKMDKSPMLQRFFAKDCRHEVRVALSSPRPPLHARARAARLTRAG